jgi:hypothetical protein
MDGGERAGMTNGGWASKELMEVTRSDESEQSDEKRQR